ncbi:MAG: hypothetical protein RJA07_458 [Bacteroidota bacterium]|jgi:hypothetical protein
MKKNFNPHFCSPIGHLNFSNKKQAVSKIARIIFMLLLISNFSLNKVFAQTIKIPNANYSISICNGGYVEIRIVNKTGTASASPIYLTTDFGSIFDDLSLIDTSLASVKLLSTGARLSFATGTTTGGGKYYQINHALPANDSIQLKVYLRPVCGYLNTQPIATPPLPVTVSHVFNFSLLAGAITSSPLINTIGISPSIILTYPKIDVYCPYTRVLSSFPLAQTGLTIGAVGSCQGYYKYKTPLTVFYKYIRLLNSPTADTLDLTNPAIFLKIHDKRVDKNIQYKIKAIHVKTASGFYRICANVSSTNSTTSTTSTNPAIFKLKSKTTALQIQDTIVLNGDIFQLAKGTKKLAPNDSLVFWEECELLPKNTTTHVNEILCGQTTQTDYKTEFNCLYKVLAGDSLSSCYTNTINDCNQIAFEGHSPNLAYKSGYIRKDLCYNYQKDTTNPLFHSHTNQYYLIVGNVGNSTASHLKLEIAIRDTSPITKYILNKQRLLNAHFAIISFTNFTTLPVPTTYSLPSGTAVANCRFTYKRGLGVIPTNPYDGSYYKIDSLKSSIGDSIELKPNQALIMIWEGYHVLQECMPAGLDYWASCITTYDSCSSNIIHFGASAGWNSGAPIGTNHFYYANQSTNTYAYVCPPPSNIQSDQLQGAGLSQVIGVPDDDYSAAPVGTMKFTIPTFASKKLLPSSSNLQNQSIAVKISIGELLNVWKGDEYNLNVPCNRPDSSGNYDKNHLKKYVRFYVDTSNGGIVPQYKRVYANCIGYLNTGIGAYHHYDSVGRPTALNGVTDEILAWFDFPSGFNVSWLKRFYVEVDVQPACAHCPCGNQPYTNANNGYLAIASKMTGSKTPVSMQVYHIPDESCGNDTIGIFTNLTTPCYIPKNRYCIFNGGSGIIVQCPGCHISGLYTIKSIGSRINFGLEDNNNDGIADATMKRILFNQVHFKTNLTNPFTSVDASSIMYHDVFRIRHQSIVHLDDSIYGNYYPTAATLGMPISTLHPHEKGYTIGYVRVKTSDSIAVFNYKNPTDSIHLQKNIPSLIVWVDDGNTMNTSSYPYRSGFNAFHPNTAIYPYQTYSISSTQTDTVTPIMLFFNPSRDFRDPITREFVYDFSLSRLDSAYRKQYNTTQHLPFDYFHDKMKLFFDVTLTLNQNPAAGSASTIMQQEAVVSKAYFTFTKETPTNYTSFFDIQDAQDQPLRNDTAKKVFVATPALLDSLCPMGTIHSYPVLVNGVSKSSCDSVRWYCVKGESDFDRIGFLFKSTTFNDPDYANSYTMNFCGLGESNRMNNTYFRQFLLGKSSITSNSYSWSTTFNYEYRNWSHCKKFEITGLPYGSVIDTMNVRTYNNYSVSNYVGIIHPKKPIVMNSTTHSWIIDFDTLIAQPKFVPIANNQDSIQQSDDNEIEGFAFSVRYPTCRDSVYCTKIREFDNFNICDLNTANTNNIIQTICGTTPTPTALINSNYVNGFGIPLNANYQNCINERFFDQSLSYKTVKDDSSLNGTSKTAMLSNGHICWDSIIITQTAANGNNPWVTVKFPPLWNDNSLTVTSIILQNKVNTTIYTTSFPVAPSGLINGVQVPKYMGNHTWLFYAPTATTSGAWRTGINYLSICATYDCNHPPTDGDVVSVNAGIICDTADFRTKTDSILQLYSISCERMIDTVFLSSTHPTIGISPNKNNYSGAGLCADFNMGYTIRNEGNECLQNVSIKINIPTTSNFSLTQATYTGMPFGKNAVLIYKGVPKFFTIHTGLNILDSLKSSFCSNVGASLPGSHMNTTDPDSVMIIFGIHADCNLSYDLIYDTVYGYTSCGGNFYFVSPAPEPHASNPILLNPSNVYNQFQPSFSIASPFNSSCTVPDSIQLDLYSILPSGSTGSTTVSQFNKLLIKIPQGVHLTSVTNNNNTLAVSNYQNCAVCKTTALNAICDSLIDSSFVYEVDLSSLQGISLLLHNPLSFQIHFTIDSSTACNSKWNAVVATSAQVSCSGSNCSFCSAQTPAVSKQMLFDLPIPTLTTYTTFCTGKGMAIAANACKHLTWIVNNNSFSNTKDTLLINSSGTYNIVAMNSLVANGVCRSDSSSIANLIITPKVTFTTTNSITPCSLQSNGQINITIANGTAPYYINFNGSVFPNTTNSFTQSNLTSGLYPIQITDSTTCSTTDTIILPTSTICGDRAICIGNTYAYFINSNIATQFSWTALGGSIVSNTPQSTVGIKWTRAGTDTLILVGKNILNQIVLTDTVLIFAKPKPMPIIGVVGGWNSCFKVTPEIVGGNIVGYDTCFQFCVHNALQFTSPYVAGHSYHWLTSNCNILNGINSDTVTILFDSLGSGSLTLTETDTTTNCTQTISKCFYIIAKPIAKALCLNYTMTNQVINICNSVSLNFADSSAPASSLINRQWNFGDGSPIVNTTGTFVNHTYTTGGTYHLTLTIENTCHCTDTFKITVNVSALPGVPVLCATTKCYNDTSTYYTTATTCSSYVWTVTNGAIVSGQSTPSIKVKWNGATNNPTGNIALAISGCAAFCTIPTNIVVPIITPTTKINCPITICKNDKIIVSVPAVQGNTYTWSSSTPSKVQFYGSLNSSNVWIRAAGNVGDVIRLHVDYYNCTIGCSGHADTTIIIRGQYAVQCFTGISCTKVCSGTGAWFTTNQYLIDSTKKFDWYYTLANSNAYFVYTSHTNKFFATFPVVSVPTPYWVYAHVDTASKYCNSSDPYIEVMVYPLPLKPTLAQILKDSCVCAYSNIVLSGVPQPNQYFTWSTNYANANPQSAVGNTFATFLNGAAPYTFAVRQVMTDEPHCQGDTLQFKVMNCHPPTGTIHGDSLVCANSISNLIAPSGFDSYEWKLVNNKDGTILKGQGTNFVTIQWNNPTANTNYTLSSYNIELKVKFCGKTLPTIKKYVVNILMPPTISITTPTTIFCTDKKVIFTANNVVSSPCALTGDFTWNFGDGTPTVTTSTNQVAHSYKIVGIYNITVAAQNNSSSHILETAIISVNVGLTPIVSLRATDSICPIAVLHARITNSLTGSFSYQYLNPTLPIITHNSSSVVDSVHHYSSYYNGNQVVVKVTNTVNGCIGESNLQTFCGDTAHHGNSQPSSYGYLTHSLKKCTGTDTIWLHVKSNLPNSYLPAAQFEINFGDNSAHLLYYPTPLQYTNAPFVSIPFVHTYTNAGKFDVEVAMKGGTPSRTATFFKTFEVPLIPDFTVLNYCNTSNAKQSQVLALNKVLHNPTTITWSGALSNTTPTALSIGSSYTETMVVTDAASPQNTCTLVKTFAVPAFPMVTIADSPWVNQCELTPLKFIGNTTSNVLGWEWTFNDLQINPYNIFYSNLKNPKEAFHFHNLTAITPKGRVDITLQITDTMLCKSSVLNIHSSSVWVDTVKEKSLLDIQLTPPVRTNCIKVGDTVGVSVKKIVAPPTVFYPPFSFTWHTGIQPYSSTNAISQAVIYQPGNYWLSVVDGNGCSTNSALSISPQFILPPTINLTGKTDLCAGEAAEYSFDAGTNYTYHWTLYNKNNVVVLAGATSSIHVPTSTFLSNLSPYKVIASMQYLSGATCGAFDSLKIKIHAPPTAAIPSLSPSSYCLQGNNPITITASASGGKPPYTYYWMDGTWGTGLSQTTALYGGQYGYHVVDSLGCSSGIAYVNIKPTADFSALLTGCLTLCDTQKLCAANDPNYPNVSWLFNGTPVSASQVIQNNALLPAQSGFYQEVMCNGSCCDTSAVVDIQVIPCSFCCHADVFNIDTIFCIGNDKAGKMQYQFRLRLTHNCPSAAVLQFQTGYGNVGNLSTTTVVPGNNTIWGIYTNTAAQTQFCATVSVSGADTCAHDVPCINLPNNCVAYSPCNMSIAYRQDRCIGIDAKGNPMYIIDVDITNNYSMPVDDTLFSYQGIVTNNIVTSIPPNNTVSTQIIFTDTLPFDGYICLYGKTVDPTTGTPCQSVTCFALTSSNQCIQTTGCTFDACIEGIACLGFDTLGNPMYQVSVHFNNPFGGYNLNAILSIISTSGLITNLTPVTPIGGSNVATFIFTDNTLSHQLCLQLIISDTIKQPYFNCSIDYTQVECLCLHNLPDCPQARLAQHHNTSTTKPSATDNATCLVKIVPNPNEGKPEIYYKLSSDNLKDESSLDNLKIRIVESSSGKNIITIPLNKAAGMIYWSSNPLPEGHYVIILQQNGKVLCNAKMEVIK